MTRPSLYKRAELAAKRYAHYGKVGYTAKMTFARLDYAAGYRAGWVAARRVKRG